MGSEPKRHHQVPVFYLGRFCADGNLWVRWRDGKQYPADPVNVAVEAGFYNIPDGAGGMSSVVESWFLGQGVEAPAKLAMEALDRSPDPQNLSDAERKALGIFLAVQMTRTTAFRDESMFHRTVLDWAAGRELTKELVAEYLEKVHLGFRPSDPEVEAAFTYVSVGKDDSATQNTDWSVRLMIDNAGLILPLLLALHWTVEVDQREEFITSDTPIVLWRKPTYRDNMQGVGVANATEIRFPLDTSKQLVMSQRQRQAVIKVGQHRVRHSNQDLADACHRFILGRCDRQRLVNAPRLHRRRPVIRFWSAPYYTPGDDGRLKKQDGDIIHMISPRRAGVGPPGANELDKQRATHYIYQEPPTESSTPTRQTSEDLHTGRTKRR